MNSASHRECANDLTLLRLPMLVHCQSAVSYRATLSPRQTSSPIAESGAHSALSRGGTEASFAKTDPRITSVVTKRWLSRACLHGHNVKAGSHGPRLVKYAMNRKQPDSGWAGQPILDAEFLLCHRSACIFSTRPRQSPLDRGFTAHYGRGRRDQSEVWRFFTQW